MGHRGTTAAAAVAIAEEKELPTGSAVGCI